MTSFGYCSRTVLISIILSLVVTHVIADGKTSPAGTEETGEDNYQTRCVVVFAFVVVIDALAEDPVSEIIQLIIFNEYDDLIKFV